MLIITVCVLIFTAICLANPVSDDEYFRKYISDIQNQIDKSVNPCEDFGKYACGNLKIDDKTNAFLYMQKLLEQYLSDYKPQNEAESMISTFYWSCKTNQNITKILEQVDILKTVKVWPVKRDFSDEEIAKLFGYLTTLEFIGLLSLSQKTLIQNNPITIKLHGSFDYDNMPALLEEFGISGEENLKIFEKIKSFIEQIENIRQLNNKKDSDADDELTDVEALKTAVPNFDWDTYFKTFTNVYGIDMNVFVKKSVKTRDLEKLKKIADLLKETDSKIVVNYIIWRYLIISEDIKCVSAVGYLFPLLSIRFLNGPSQYPTKFLLKELELLNHFEKTFSELKSQLNNPTTVKIMTDLVQKKKTVYKHYEELLYGEYLLKLFKNFEMNEETLYLNIVNINHAMNQLIVDSGEESNFEALSNILTLVAEKVVQIDEEPLSSLENFIEENTDLWTKAISLDQIYENRTINEKCFPYENNTENYKNTNYLNYHAAYHIALHDYINYVDENKDQFKKHTEILTEAGLNNAKMYMLSMAQKRCSESNNKNLNNDYFLWYLKHSKDFSETWGCSAGDEMNDICDDSTFVPNF